ncbi:hypothetical protein QBC35DRAFT_231475 [Podospora australis]|uniref:F-box domain-containing protein n=1 Tax=Podospora australis TaxID=1536484 RepID=A0AAN6WT60_9PEZI|nr:hypothetical protein QBC35DRAFT_231475 [Podospora australis]
MEQTHSSTIARGRPSLPNPSSSKHDGIDRSSNDAEPAYLIGRDATTPHKNVAVPSIEEGEGEPVRAPDTAKSCDRLRPEEEERLRPKDSMTNMSSLLIGKTVTPFLREHIPSLYAPIGKSQNEETSKAKNPNTRYCYRHRPDSKCRRAADEAKMVMIQTELDKLTAADQQAITHVWSLFSAAPARHRELMLQGVLSQLCFPQLSLVSREVNEALKIDFITALPVELSQKILCYLDTVSLTKAAQVSQRWRQLADDDAVWVRMCEQHVNRKCTKCGWGLPLLERKRLRNYTRQRQLAKDNTNGRIQEITESGETNGDSHTHSHSHSHSGKRAADLSDEELGVKRRRIEEKQEKVVELRTRSWKDVYKDRWEVGYNWRFGRCSVRVLKGHTNGVTCLQLDDNVLATGSYDATIKIWNIETGEEIRTLRGHTRGIRALQFDDSKLISGSLDNTIKIWNWHTGECIRTLQGHTDGVVSVHFEGQLLASGSIDKSVKIFDFNSKEAYCLKGHGDWVNCTRLDTTSRTVMSASDDTTVKLWDLDTRQVIRTFEGHVGHVQQILLLPPEYEPDDELLNGVNGSGDNTDAVSVSSGRDGTPQVSFGQPAPTSSPSRDEDLRASYGSGFATDTARPLPARYFLSGGLDSTIRLWDSATGRCLKTMFGHLEGIWALAGDTIRVISGANDGMVKCWEPRSGKCDATFVGHRGPVTCVGLNDSLMASGSEDGEIRLYSFKSNGNGADAGTPVPT